MGRTTAGVFRPGLGVMIWVARNDVRPVANTIRTTPTMIWSVWYLTDITASRAPMNAPPSAPASSPSQTLPKRLLTSAPAKAAVRNCASMAMFMTPARSHSTPASAPKVRGTAARIVRLRIDSRLSDWPAVAQVRKANRNRTTTTPSTR